MTTDELELIERSTGEQRYYFNLGLQQGMEIEQRKSMLDLESRKEEIKRILGEV